MTKSLDTDYADTLILEIEDSPQAYGVSDFPYPSFTAEDWALLPSIQTEDDTPVDNLLSDKNQRMLVEILYSTWSHQTRTRFLAAANVGIFSNLKTHPIVPDVFLSLNVPTPSNWWQKQNRSYFVQYFGKPPDVVVEIVSNTYGGEDTDKLTKYAAIGVPYYVIYDPYHSLSKVTLRTFALQMNGYYLPLQRLWFPTVGLGVRLWTGTYEDIPSTWLRWCDHRGTIIPTGQERAVQEHRRANQEFQRANQESRAKKYALELAQKEAQRAEQEAQRATKAQNELEQLWEKLRTLGIKPEDL